MAHAETTTAQRPSAKSKTRDRIIVEAAGDPALAAPALAEIAQSRPRPTYVNNPALVALADARREAALVAEDGGPAEERADQDYRALIAAPARTLDDVIGKLAAYIVENGGGRIEVNDPSLFEGPDGMGLHNIDDLGQIGRDLIGLASPPPASDDFNRLRDEVLELHNTDRDLPDAGVAAEAALQEQFFKTPAPNARAVADKLRLGLNLDGYLTEVVEFAVADLERIADEGARGRIGRDPEAEELGRRTDAVIPLLEAEKGGPGYDAEAHAELDAIIKAAFASEATSPAMLRVKARLADYWIARVIRNVDMEDLSMILAAGVVKGVLATPLAAGSDPKWEAARQRLIEARDAYEALVVEQCADDGSDAEYTKALQAKAESAVDVWFDALAALDAAPAPDLAALAFKLRESLALANGSEAALFDDPAEFAEAYWEASQRNGQIGFIVYQDILRLIEPASPVIGVGPWRAVDFIDQYRKARGDLRWVMTPDGECGLINAYPEGHAGHPLTRELAESPWKQAAVEARLQWEAENSPIGPLRVDVMPPAHADAVANPNLTLPGYVSFIDLPIQAHAAE